MSKIERKIFNKKNKIKNSNGNNVKLDATFQRFFLL
jgi:hypothetical protein